MSDSQENPLDSTTINNDFYVVGIGASAGGLSALEELFSNLSTASGAAFVVIQHLSPDFKSLMKGLLERRTSMSIHRVTEGMELKANSVYLIPPGQNLTLEQNILRLENRQKDKNKKHKPNFPIDLFFTSLAKNYGERSIGVILSGTGSDGTRGLKAINEAGGVTLVQDPDTAEFDGMPVSAIDTGIVNRVLPPRELSRLIYQCIVASVNSFEAESSTNNLINNDDLSQIAKLLLSEEGFDFSQYKSSTISRRIHRRYLIHHSASIAKYISLLKSSPEERQALCSDLLINVTHFFRDYRAWQNLENNILPLMIQQSKVETELRFWITACSTGEEAYSLAILVHEALQDSNKNIRVKIFATDIDRVALDKASQGVYPLSIARDVGDERLQKYFVAKDNSFQIVRKIREMLIFSPHDLTKDAGFTRINLITCRNVLIYMQSDLQYQVLRNLHFSLVSKGVLFLGKAEMLGEFESEFASLDKKWRFFQKRRDVRLPLPSTSTSKPGRGSLLNYNQPQKVQVESILEQCLERLSDESNSVILLISKENHLLHVSGDSNKILRTISGKITTEVTKMVVLPLQIPLNTALHRAKQLGKAVSYQGIKLDYQGETIDVSLKVIPAQSDKTRIIAAQRTHGNFFLVKIKQEKAVTPKEVSQTETSKLSSDASERIVDLESELQLTKENLQAFVEELETTNEEQQASNEELTASNEELQSTNEELHSVNEELHTVNIEYQSKIRELIQLNNDVDNLLKSTEIGVIFLDEQLKIRKFTPAAVAAVSLLDADLNRPLRDLYWKFECPNLFDLLHEVLETRQHIELEVKAKESENFFLMQINPYQTDSKEDEGLVIGFVKIDEIKRVQNNLEREIIARKRTEEQLRVNQEQLLITQERVENIFSSLEDAVWSFDLPEKKLGYLNTAFEAIYGRSKQEFYTDPDLWFEVIHPEDKEMVQEAHRLIKQQEKLDIEYRILLRDRSVRWLRDRSKIIYDDRRTPVRKDFVISDITAQKLAQQALKERELSFQAVFNSTFQFVEVLNPAGILLEANRTALAFGGLNPEDVLNRPFWEAKWWTISKATQARLKKAIAEGAAQGKFVRYEVDVLGAEDRVATIDFSLNPVTDETGKVVQIIAEGREITELKQAREELQQTNQELEQRVAERTEALANFSDRLKQLHHLAISDYETLADLYNEYLKTGCEMFDLSTGIVSQVSKGIYKILAVQSPLDMPVGMEIECQNTYCAEVIEEQTTVAYADVRQVVQMQNHPVYRQFDLKSFIGTPIFVNGTLYGTLNFSSVPPRGNDFESYEGEIIELMARDIGNSIAAFQNEIALKQSEAEFRKTFEQATVGIAHVSLEGKFLKVNSQLCKILGYSNQELLKMNLQTITYPEDLALDEKYITQIIAKEADSCTYEKRYIHADGSAVWANLTFCMVEAEGDNPDYFIAVIEDISDRKQNEIALLQASQAKDTFIAHMSHELRTPLNSVIGFSHILTKDSRLVPEQLKFIDLINQSGQHLLTLINDVLDLSKLNANKLEINYRDLNLAIFLQDITNIFQIRTQEKSLKFATQISDDVFSVVNTDETKLRQVLFNLLSNAVKFTSTGTVSLSVSCLTSDPNRNIKTVRFQVEDTGKGIPEDKHETIFTPFEQLDQNNHDAEGTGLGLPICQDILSLMDSQLYLTSQVGKGSCFWFDLDFQEVSNHGLFLEAKYDDLTTRVLTTPYKVLVVDDNKENRFLLLKYLQNLGFTLEQAINGREAIAIAREFQPDVILLDLVMPVMDGRETVEAIRKDTELQDTVVLMVSANVQLIQDSSKIEYDGFLAKPIDLDKLLELLEKHLPLEWQTLNEEPRSNAIAETDFVIPPQENLIELFELASLGLIKKLSQQINLLEEIDSEYIHFASKIRQFADACQLDSLEEFLENLIESEKQN